MTDIAHRPSGKKLDVKHACPECPIPFVGGIARLPNPFCPWCWGTGLVTAQELHRWEYKLTMENPT